MSFDLLYKKLNPEQKEAVDTTEGPVMVIAGPGTGKTRILSLRIANIIRKTDIEPENILALTFTESGTVSIRKSLIEIIGNAGYLVNVFTFHGFCNKIINENPEEFQKIIGAVNISEGKQIKIIKSIIEESEIYILKPYGNPLFYLKSIISSIEKLKREGISFEDFKNIIREEENNLDKKNIYHKNEKFKGTIKGEYQKIIKNIEKNKELSLIYEKYESELRNQRLYDYNDMIIEVLNAFSNKKEFLLSVQEKYQYILVDEHQDTNNSQNKILELILNFHKNPNIFLVGDKKQAIYRFQGASVLNFNHFKNIYPEIKTIELKKNYRSPKKIIDVAENIFPSGLITDRKEGEVIFFSFPGIEEESFFITKEIEKKIKKEKVKPSEIAIIFRDNRDSLNISNFLEKSNIPFSIGSEGNILEDSEIKKIILILKTINDFSDEEYLFLAMHIDFLKIDPFDIFIISEKTKKEKISIYNFIRSEEFDSLKIRSKKNIVSFFENIIYLKTISKNENISFLVEELIYKFQIVPYILKKSDSLEKINNLKIFLKEIKKYDEEKLEEFISYIDLIKKHGFIIKKRIFDQSEEKVKLLTAHKAKGLEFDYVYIINTSFGHWGDRRNSDLISLPEKIFSIASNNLQKEEKNEEEKKLFYVAITRAKKRVVISYPKRGEKENLPSRFIEEIKNKVIIEKDKKENNLIFTKKKENKKIIDKKTIKRIFTEKGISATGINNYLECPLKYFYLNIIGMPKKAENSQIYGTIVHESLRDFFESLKNKETKKDFLISSFLKNLEKQNLKKDVYKQIKERGLKNLKGYYDFYNGKWNKNIITEFKIKLIYYPINAPISGSIDKLEILDGREVKIVDYKTGKPQTKNQIEGKTKNSTGNIKRQLVFYNLLLNKYKKGKYKTIFGEIDFITPNQNGIYKKESFEITIEELKDLEEIMEKMSKEITSLSFLNKGCKEKDCIYCQMKEMLE